MSAVIEQLHRGVCRLPAEGCKPALSDNCRQIEWADLIALVEATAAQLTSLGIRRLGLCADNSVDWALIDLAAQHADIVLIPLPHFFTAQQACHSARSAGVDYLLTDAELPKDWLKALIPGEKILQPIAQTPRLDGYPLSPESSDPLPTGCQKITFTSGSTGQPKGVCLSACHQWQVAESLATATAMSAPHHLCLIPLATLLENIGGIYTPLLCGGSVHFASASERGISGSSSVNARQLLAAISSEEPNSLIVIPQLLALLVSAAQSNWQPPSSLKFIAVGGARTAPRLLEQAIDLGLPVYEGYGLSECGSVVALNTAECNFPGTAGKILPHCDVTIKHGEVIIHSPCFLGYVDDRSSWEPTEVASGDLGQIDENGFLTISGRRKNLLITSFGRNVSPEWVESLLLGGTLLRRCVVVGDGEAQLTALIDSDPQRSQSQLAEWVEACNQQLPDYARIGHCRVIEEKDWPPLLTANGRPRRDSINQFFTTLPHQLEETL